MENENETVADIVAEMRGPYYKMGRSNASLDKDMMGYMSFMANRIEAAAKREREAGADAAQICGEIGEMIGMEAACKEKVAECNRLGNAAKIREALSDACYAMFNFLKTQNGGYEEMAEALDKAKAVLSAPPRNFDVGTADEQVRRHLEWCEMNAYKCQSTPSCAVCLAEWSQMPYEEGREEAKK